MVAPTHAHKDLSHAGQAPRAATVPCPTRCAGARAPDPPVLLGARLSAMCEPERMRGLRTTAWPVAPTRTRGALVVAGARRAKRGKARPARPPSPWRRVSPMVDRIPPRASRLPPPTVHRFRRGPPARGGLAPWLRLACRPLTGLVPSATTGTNRPNPYKHKRYSSPSNAFGELPRDDVFLTFHTSNSSPSKHFVYLASERRVVAR